MTLTSDDENGADDFTEAITGEYPAIKDGSAEPAPHLNGTHTTLASPAAAGQSEKAAFWLAHLEIEVTRLHAKWNSIDAEFKVRETRIAQLRDELKGRDTAIEKLTADVQAGVNALQDADARIGAKEAEIAKLIGERTQSEGRAQQLASALEGSEARHRELAATLASVEADVVRLNAAVLKEQEAAATLAALNEELLADQLALRGKLQDLETYIDGRHHSWSEMTTQLAGYKDALLGMERALKARDVSMARHDEEKRELAARILDLERQCSELAGRRKEREAAYADLQSKLSEHFEATEQLKSEHANRMRETEHALAKAREDAKLVQSLERDVARRDETLAALGAELESRKAAVAELTGAKEKLARRADELEETRQDLTQQAQALRDELHASHDETRALREQLGERTTELAASHEALAEKARLADRLAQDSRDLSKQLAEVREDLTRLEEHSAELGRLRADTIAERDGLRAELSAQQALVASLETDLRAKRATADMLERNVGRITDLGASLAALDRRLDDAAPDSRPPDQRFADFVETVAADESVDRVAAGDLISFGSLVGDAKSRDPLDGARPLDKTPAARKLVVMLGEGIDYPLVKDEMTIGRGHGSDIRIASHFISRLHAKVTRRGIATVIEDAGSKNGLLVNQERVRRRVLRDGDVVSLGGELNLRFVDAAP
jgi:chromosome segregation ATPase